MPNLPTVIIVIINHRLNSLNIVLYVFILYEQLFNILSAFIIFRVFNKVNAHHISIRVFPKTAAPFELL